MNRPKQFTFKTPIELSGRVTILVTDDGLEIDQVTVPPFQRARLPLNERDRILKEAEAEYRRVCAELEIPQ